jgi:hypothetical protein
VDRSCSTKANNVTRIGYRRKSRRKETSRKTKKWDWLKSINMDLVEIGWGGLDWIDRIQGRDKWRALLNVVMNFQLHMMLGGS